MYKMIKLENTVRIPPEQLMGDLDATVRALVQKSFEGTVVDEGLVVLATNIELTSDGRVMHGSGDVFLDVRYEALTWNLDPNEVLDGYVVEVNQNGAYVNLGPIDGLCHNSQITDDYVTFDEGRDCLVGKQSGRILEPDDMVRGSIASIQLHRLEPRKSRIGINMRSRTATGLGKFEWIEADRERNRGGQGGEE